jgi:hypothetical protein
LTNLRVSLVIDPSAWKVDSVKSVGAVLHRPSSQSPLRAARLASKPLGGAGEHKKVALEWGSGL